MSFLLTIAGVATAATLLAAVVLRIARRLLRRKSPGFWRRVLLAHLLVVPLNVFATAPLFLGWFGSRQFGTRPDERAYGGPRIDADGVWTLQSRASLRAERDGEATQDPASVASSSAAEVRFTTADGVAIRAFHVLPRAAPPRCSVILVHGLFRGALELEAPASMFRDLGAEALMIEMRNHGGSGRAPASFGFREREDVLAAVKWIRADAARAARPLVLYAVSLGTAAVLGASPGVPDLAGVVLDAPMDDLRATAHRMLDEGDRAGRRGPRLPYVFRSLTILALELWSDFCFDDVRPIADAARLPPDLPVLLIGGGEDRRMPRESVEAIFNALPEPPARRTLWIRPGSDHAGAWSDDPAAYRARLAALLELAAPR